MIVTMQGLTARERRWTLSLMILTGALLSISSLSTMQVGGAATQVQCGKLANNSVCPNQLCCSAFGFCGPPTSDSQDVTTYCGTGCQSGNCIPNSPPFGGPQCDKDHLCSDRTFCCSGARFCGVTEDYCGVGCLNGPCLDQTPPARKKVSNSGLSTGAFIGIAVAVVLTLMTILGAILFFHYRRNQRKLHKTGKGSSEIGSEVIQIDDSDILRNMPAISKLYNQTSKISFGSRFSLEALTCATDGFSKELGRGAFGVVYKGTLKDDQLTDIAVKKLVDNERGLKDFEAEVKTLGSINHANLVALRGFCFERSQPFLVYEYVSNGSLDKWIFAKERPDTMYSLPWKTRVDIAKGTAKGLAYLHEDLQIGQAIIHLDIKPENILLDTSFTPKVADFGMAKLLGSRRTQTLASGGTFGYMAPEVYTGSATSRMDVYSFGIVLLELLSGRRHLDYSLPADRFYLPAWAIRKAGRREELEVLEPFLEVDGYDAQEARRIILVALLCLQRDPEFRPDMSTVLRMIEGVTIPRKLPGTLQAELEMTERLVRRGPPGSTEGSGESCFIDLTSTIFGPEDLAKAGRYAGVNGSSQRPLLHISSSFGQGRPGPQSKISGINQAKTTDL